MAIEAGGSDWTGGLIHDDACAPEHRIFVAKSLDIDDSCGRDSTRAA
jgi:hypothetical protein